jgi:microcystin-dependent protein
LTVGTNPATLWGIGTWESVQGKFLLGAGGGYTAGSTGGAATHTLTANEMPSHYHKIYQ